MFDYTVIPAKPRPILCLAGKTAGTPGNIGVVQAPVKSGKSTVMEAIMAAIFNVFSLSIDTLGFESENFEGKAVVHLDTEQSPYDHDALVRRAMRRAKVHVTPDWFTSVCLTDFTVTDRLAAFEKILADEARRCGGVFMVLIDGVADLCLDPNDPAEAFALVGRLHALAVDHDCLILLAIHENPGSEAGKTRGHLGSQLERKAETPFRLAKDAATGTTTIWSDRARHGHIPREQGSCFSWSDEAGMHVSRGSASAIKASAKNAKFREEAETAFGDQESLSYSALVESIMKTANLKIDASKKRVQSYCAEGIVSKLIDGSERGTYSLVPARGVSVLTQCKPGV
ncbi:MAG: hypothetical protein CFE26_25810 [Verrucomicrobiales bacterium VVV1]|nr:MAG: hypothetical protein CFE26_25810 [Verrucomicrobiales bacterium VVV1]